MKPVRIPVIKARMTEIKAEALLVHFYAATIPRKIIANTTKNAK